MRRFIGSLKLMAFLLGASRGAGHPDGWGPALGTLHPKHNAVRLAAARAFSSRRTARGAPRAGSAEGRGLSAHRDLVHRRAMTHEVRPRRHEALQRRVDVVEIN